MRDAFHDYIEHARWFGGKGRAFTVDGFRRLTLPDGDSDRCRVRVELVDLVYDDGGRDTYQVPVAYHEEESQELAHALIGTWDDEELGEVWAYDALHDHAATPVWLRAFAEGAATDDVRFHRVGSPDLDVEARSALLTGEQSNSSLAFGSESLMKVFRRVTPGRNPDIEILAALTEAGNEHVAALFGYMETPADPEDPDGDPLQLGILQQFLTTASDGWDLALASLRNLYSDGHVHPEEAGGDFAAEAQRLGVAVADLHTSLAAAFGTETWDRDRLAALAGTMTARLDEAVAAVPALEEHADGLRDLFDAVRDLDHAGSAHRVHGDLHLGQTLRTVRNWKIIDFEGEPAKSLEERRRPDSPWRDVAGMLRSFDYAAELSRRDHDESTGDVDEHDAEQAREWAQHNQRAFLAGYQAASGAEVDRTLLTAYAADKAVYEAVYEARNRPAWLPIPLSALARLTRGDTA